MVARNTDITLTADTWVELTASDVTAVRIQNFSRFMVAVQATTGVAPSGATQADKVKGAIRMLGNDGMAADLTLALTFGGVTGAVRVWAYCVGQTVDVSVSHA